MACHILDLPVELQEYIFSCCSISDIKRLVFVNKDYYHAVHHLLWREIDISWKSIQKSSESTIQFEKLKLTSEINFIDKDDGNDKIPKPSKWVHVASNYRKILKNCDVNRLTRLKVEGLVADNGIKMACSLLSNLKELWLSSCNYTTISAWQQLSAKSSLRKLTIEDCRIFNEGMQAVCQSESLIELHIKDCQYVNDNSMEYIGKMSKLKKLTVSHNRNITTKGLHSLSKLRHLTFLRLEYIDVDEEGLQCLCQLTIRLEKVNINGLHQLIVTGFYEFPSLGKKKKLKDSDLPKVAMKHFGKMKGMQQDNTTEDLVLTINKNAKPKDGKQTLSWKCTILT